MAKKLAQDPGAITELFTVGDSCAEDDLYLFKLIEKRETVLWMSPELREFFNRERPHGRPQD